MPKDSEMKSTKKRGKLLLIEPTVEEEQQAMSNCCMFKQTDRTTTGDTLESSVSEQDVATNVIQNKSAKEARNGRQKRGELNSILMILFGSILILLIGCSSVTIQLVHSKQQPKLLTQKPLNSATNVPIANTTQTEEVRARSTPLSHHLVSEDSSNKTTTVAATTTEEVVVGITESTGVEETTILLNTSSLPTDTTTTGSAEAEVEGAPVVPPSSVEVGNNSSSEDEGEAAASPSADELEEKRLGSLIVDTVDIAAEQLVDRLRSGGNEDPPAETSGNENGEEADDAIERHDDGPEKRQAVSSALIANKTMADSSSSTNDEDELKLALKTYSRWVSTADDIIELFSKKMLPLIVEHGYEVDGVTVTGLLQVFNGIRAYKPWAMKLLDASAKITPGLLVGTQSDFGDFDECLNVRVDDPSGLAASNGLDSEIDELTGLKSSTIVGRYCLADLEFPKPPRQRLVSRNEELDTDFAPIELRRPLFNFSDTPAFKNTIFVETGNFFHMLYVDPVRIALCLTNKIDPDNFARVVNKILEDFKITINFRGRCVTKYERPIWSTYQKISAYVLVVVCSLVVLCTILDIFHNKIHKMPLPACLNSWKVNLRCSMFKHRPLFTSFSIIRNTKRLFEIKPPTIGTTTTKNLHLSGRERFDLNLAQAMAHCSNSTSGSCQALSSDSEPSPSTERRSSATSSSMNLISEPSSSLTAVRRQVSQEKKYHFNRSYDGSYMFKLKEQQKHLEQQQQQTVPSHKKETNLLCLHGIRVITMTWMIVNHTYLFGGFFVLWAYRRLIDIAEWPKSVSFQLVLNGWLTVETYFFLSAAIIVLNVMPQMRANKFSYSTYILHRLLRLLPAYTGLICLNFLWPLISSGPVWLVKGKSYIQSPCENHLWQNFLFISNWNWPEKQCMVHTWFLSADFQLYLLAPIVVYLLYRRPVLGHSMNIIVAIIASIFSGFVIYANKLLPATLINKLEFDALKQQLSYSYFATYQHMGPYCLGIFTGYLLHKRPQVRLPKHLTWLLWLLLPPLSFTTFLLTYLWNGAYDEPAMINPSPLVSAFYVAIHRTIWTSLVAWIVFSCATGRANLLSSFLSHPVFIPLSRLSFSVYLVHFPVIMFRALNVRHTLEWTDSNILWEACGNFVFSLIGGYFLNVAFESPIINLERVIFGRQPTHELEVSKMAMSGSQRGHKQPTELNGEAKERNPIQQVSKNSIDNDFDDNKSAESTSGSGDQPLSLSDQERKLSDSSIIDAKTTTTTKSQMLLPRHMRWTEQQHLSKACSSLNRKALRPKQNPSVEKIFGNQMEPHTLRPDCDQLSTDNLSSSDLPPRHQRVQLNANEKQPSRRYSSHELPMTPEDPFTNDLYPIGSEYQHYAASRDHRYHHQEQQRQHQRINNSLRPTQYATLARTSRFNHDPSFVNSNFEYRNPLYMGSSKSRSHLGESISRPPTHEAAYLIKQRAQMALRQRQGRYNTLTGTGSSRDWRQQYTGEIDNDNWRMAPQLQPNNSLVESSASWLQPGGMIPRIDSSTLRRHPKRTTTDTASSIVEEPTYEECENSAM